MGEVVDPKKKKVVPSSKVPESGAGSRDAGSYGAARLLNTPFAQDVGGAFKKAGSFLKDVSGKMVDNQVSTENKFNENVGTAKRYFLGTTDLSPEKRELDQALRQNTFKPSTLSLAGSVQNSPGSEPTNTVPSKLIGAQQDAGTSRFDKSKLTLGNNPYTGQVGMFKDGQMLDPSSVRLSGGNLGGTPLPVGQSPFFMKSEAAKGLVPQPGTASAIPGMQQNPAVTVPGGDWTAAMNQETAMLNTVLGKNMKPGQYQDFSKSIGMNPSTPGGDAAYRNIEAQISRLNTQNSQLMGGYGQSVEMGNMSKTKRLAMVQANNEQIKSLSDSLTGRSVLANDLVKALLAAQTGKETTAMTANAGTEQERIKALADVQVGAMTAGSTATAQQSKDARQDQKDSARLSIDSLKIKADRYKELEKTGSLTPEQLKDYESILSHIQRIGSSYGGFATGALPGNTEQLN